MISMVNHSINYMQSLNCLIALGHPETRPVTSAMPFAEEEEEQEIYQEDTWQVRFNPPLETPVRHSHSAFDVPG